MILKKIFALSAILFSFNSFCQKNDSLSRKSDELFVFAKKNSINLEAFGHGLFYSLSYERIIVNKGPFKVSIQAGTAIYPYPTQIDLWVPVSLNFIKTIGKKRKNHFEAGTGIDIRFDQFYNVRTGNPWQTFIIAKAGYRYQKPNGRLVFKILFTPFYEIEPRNLPTQQSNFQNTFLLNNFHPSGALSVGYTF